MTSRFSSIRAALLTVLFSEAFWGLSVLLFLPDFASAAASPAARSRAKDLENTIPLHFDVLGDGIELPPLELDYDLSSGRTLEMGGLQLNETSINARLLPVKKLHSKFAKILPKEEADQFYFLFQWPEGLLPIGNLEMISRSGRVVLKYDLSSKWRTDWKNQLDAWKANLVSAGVPKATAAGAQVFKFGFGAKVDLSKRDGPFEVGLEPFRFCLTKDYEQGFARLCSAMFEVRTVDKTPAIFLLPVSAAPPRVIAFNEAAPLKNSVAVTKDKPIQFFAELSSGVSYEFASIPLPLNLVEMTAEPGASEAQLISWGLHPTQPVKELNKEEEGFFDKIGFQQTIGDLREFWEASISLADPVIYLPGQSGGVFKQKIIINKLPSDSFRPYLDRRTVDNTYVDNVKVFGRGTPGARLSTQQNSIHQSSSSQDFTWYFRAQNRGEVNKSYLLIQSGENEFKAYHEIFKGYPREISTRLSGIVSSEGSLVMMGEFAFNYWFEDVFGWTHYYLARHRWGLSTKYFQSLSNFAISNTASSANSGILKVTTIDLKYRLHPGLWNRDESWGVSGSYQKVNYLSFDSSFFGAGIFWARSMPKVFDDLMNLLKVFQFPKWVDAEFILYVAPADTKTKINSLNYALNFHGKVMWTNSFFGEAGFGLKQYSFQDSISAKKIQFGSLYGTAGIGFNF